MDTITKEQYLDLLSHVHTRLEPRGLYQDKDSAKWLERTDYAKATRNVLEIYRTFQDDEGKLVNIPYDDIIEAVSFWYPDTEEPEPEHELWMRTIKSWSNDNQKPAFHNKFACYISHIWVKSTVRRMLEGELYKTTQYPRPAETLRKIMETESEKIILRHIHSLNARRGLRTFDEDGEEEEEEEKEEWTQQDWFNYFKEIMTPEGQDEEEEEEEEDMPPAKKMKAVDVVDLSAQDES